MKSNPTSSNGISLIEVLIVLAIISLLLQLLLPAIESSRESARQTECRNNLKQIVLAFQLHHELAGHLPTSGWGWKWTGHPDRGFDKRQPGGWAYNILPFIEQQSIRDLGAGLSDGSPEKADVLLTANATPIPVFNCPSRRLPRVYPLMHTGFSPLLPPKCAEGNGNCKVSARRLRGQRRQHQPDPCRE